MDMKDILISPMHSGKFKFTKFAKCLLIHLTLVLVLLIIIGASDIVMDRNRSLRLFCVSLCISVFYNSFNEAIVENTKLSGFDTCSNKLILAYFSRNGKDSRTAFIGLFRMNFTFHDCTNVILNYWVDLASPAKEHFRIPVTDKLVVR